MIEGSFSLGGVEWGEGTPLPVTEFSDGELTGERNRYEPAMRDGVRLGRGFKRGRTLSWTAFTDTLSPADAIELTRQMRSEWDAEKYRNTPEARAELKLRVFGGELRSVYGTPTRFDISDNKLMRWGINVITCEFETLDRWYYGAWGETLINGYVAPSGYRTYHFYYPKTYVGESNRTAPLLVTNPEGAKPVITFHGPSNNPYVMHTASGNYVQYLGTLSQYQEVVIDTREFAQTATRTGGANVSARVKGTRLGDFVLPYGENYLSYVSSDTTGTSYVKVAYQDRSTSY